MKKTETTIIEAKQIIHKFYCDHCGELFMASIEYDDGYYEEPSSGLEYHIRFNHQWYKFTENCLCEKCAKEYTKKIEIGLKELGFTPDEY